MKGVKGQGSEEGVKGVKGGLEASELRLNSRQVQAGPQFFQAGPDWASIPGRSRLGLHALPFLSFPLCGVCGLHPFTRFAGCRASPLHPGVAGCGASPLHPFTRGLRASPLHPFTRNCGLHPFTPSPGGCGLRGFTASPGGCGLRGFTPSPLHPGVAGCGASLLHPGFAGCGASPGKARNVELCALECCVCWLPAAQYRKTPFARLGSSEAVFQLSSVVSLPEACCAIIEAECATWPVTGSLCAAWEVTAWSPQTSLLFPMSHGRLPPCLPSRQRRPTSDDCPSLSTSSARSPATTRQ